MTSTVKSERIETGKFTYKVKTKTGYSMNMTGSIFGPKHGTVVVSALDSQLSDDFRVLDAAPKMLEILQSTKRLFLYRGDDAADFAANIEADIDDILAKIEGRS